MERCMHAISLHYQSVPYSTILSLMMIGAPHLPCELGVTSAWSSQPQYSMIPNDESMTEAAIVPDFHLYSFVTHKLETCWTFRRQLVGYVHTSMAIIQFLKIFRGLSLAAYVSIVSSCMHNTPLTVLEWWMRSNLSKIDDSDELAKSYKTRSPAHMVGSRTCLLLVLSRVVSLIISQMHLCACSSATPWPGRSPSFPQSRLTFCCLY